jgi:hypothetical protein
MVWITLAASMYTDSASRLQGWSSHLHTHTHTRPDPTRPGSIRPDPTQRTANHSRGILDRISMLNGPPPPSPDVNVGGSWPRWSSPAGTQAEHPILKSGEGGGGPLSMDTRSSIPTNTRKYVCPNRFTLMPRRVELLSGAYMDYYYNCTVIVVSWYVPNGDLRGGVFLLSSSSATQRALSMDTLSSTDLFSDDINAEYEIRSPAPFFLDAII